jgi:hypothetical protein
VIFLVDGNCGVDATQIEQSIAFLQAIASHGNAGGFVLAVQPGSLSSELETFAKNNNLTFLTPNQLNPDYVNLAFIVREGQ